MKPGALITPWLFVLVFIVGCGERYSYLTYRDVILNGPSAGKINRIYPADPNRIPSLFVKLPNGEVFRLEELSEVAVSKIDGTQHTRSGDVDLYSCGETNLHFQRGKLVVWTIGDGPLQIGRDQHGPFRALPMSNDEIHQMFGKPEREGRASKPMFRWQ